MFLRTGGMSDLGSLHFLGTAAPIQLYINFMTDA